MKYLAALLAAFALLTPLSVSADKAQTKIPTFSIVSVVANETVEIATRDFPADDTFTVTMGVMGTRGVDGIVVDAQDSNDGGVFSATYDIPDELAGKGLISIRLESETSGYYAYNWFYNNTTMDVATPPASEEDQPSDTDSGDAEDENGRTETEGTEESEDTDAAPEPAQPHMIPTFSITAVVRNGTVEISAKDFPANDSFTVTMGAMGTRGVGGIVVDTQATGEDGTFTATYDIPEALNGSHQISIRLQSPTSGYYSFNWFYNYSTK